MKIITALRGTVETNGPWHDPRGCITALLDEPQPGYLRKVHLSGAGLTIESGPTIIGIPLAAILELVERCEPGLIAPSPAAAPAAALASAAASLAQTPKP